MENIEEQQLVMSSSVDNIVEGYLNVSMKKVIRVCGNKEKAYKIMDLLSEFYMLKDDVKIVLIESLLDF